MPVQPFSCLPAPSSLHMFLAKVLHGTKPDSNGDQMPVFLLCHLAAEQMEFISIGHARRKRPWQPTCGTGAE